jgi:hypothetical protein
MDGTEVELERVDSVHLAHNMNQSLTTLNTAMRAGCLKYEKFLSQHIKCQLFKRETAVRN